jgi:uncharacterized protein
MMLNNKWALVTGASSGLGSHFARQLGRKGYNLFLTARREERLNELKDRILKECDIRIEICVGDLALDATRQKLYETTEGAGLSIDVLINNAGFGTLAPFAKIPWETTAQQLDLNIKALTHLTHLFVPGMLKRQQGYVLNVSSIAGFMPIPNFATYAAGKAYVRSFSEALAHEFTGTGVHICCLCPGGTRTEFSSVAGINLPSWQAKTFLDPEDCVRLGLKAMFHGRISVVHGAMNVATGLLMNFVPRSISARMAQKILSSESS